MIRLQIRYFASLREQTGCNHETLETQATTATELYQELRQRYPFTLELSQLRVAVNDEFVSSEAVLAADDTVVFIPPVSGG